MGLKKIVLITTGQPSTNPRIVKEANALHCAGYDVTLLYCFYIDWASKQDAGLLQNISWKYKRAGGSPFDEKTNYFFTRLINKLAALFSKFFGWRFLLAERTQARAYDALLKEAKKIKADWYIGHNLGALAVAVNAARYHGAKAGFDFEDYHRGEQSEGDALIRQRNAYLENKYLPLLQYYSTASPLITERIKDDHPEFKGQVITLRNCFSLTDQPPYVTKAMDDGTLQLWWFSQTIGINRGLEQIVQALDYLNDSSIHLTLAGRCDAAMKNYIEKNAGSMLNNIHFAGIIYPAQLPAFGARFDVGLALELTVPENRNICLTNKVFTYLLAGNAILFSATAMQQAFNDNYPVGLCVDINNIATLSQQLLKFKDKKKLLAQKIHNYELGKNELNWERESEKLVAMVATN